ncbi:MAG: hypothetical protein HPY52_10940 [Firmicutes bacterium]|nr:hypothetical protein [Bacillota bacterium]
MLYARALLLRNCGRFTHVSSDFGSQYHTHIFVTSEALHAGLTRGATWRHTDRYVDLTLDAAKGLGRDYFHCDYDVSRMPVWFTPGLFVDEGLQVLGKSHQAVDSHYFNVVDEGYPSTGANGRPYFVPTYGTIEGVLPDHRLFTWALSPSRTELEGYIRGQVFLLGKKRTMFQIVSMGNIVDGQRTNEKCNVPYLELPPADSQRFASFSVLAVTARYILLQGETRDSVPCWKFYDGLPFGELILPEFYLNSTPLPRTLWDANRP